MGKAVRNRHLRVPKRPRGFGKRRRAAMRGRPVVVVPDPAPPDPAPGAIGVWLDEDWAGAWFRVRSRGRKIDVENWD